MAMDTSSLRYEGYEIELLTNLPVSNLSGPRYYYPGAKQDGGQDGIFVKICSTLDESKNWIGIFAPGRLGKTSITGIYESPQPGTFCVVSSGRGYIVGISHPSNNFEIAAIPVLQVLRVPGKQLLLFADYTKIIAWGITGLAWKSSRLSWDGLGISAVETDSVSGTGVKPGTNERIPFRLDVETGLNLLPGL